MKKIQYISAIYSSPGPSPWFPHAFMQRSLTFFNVPLLLDRAKLHPSNERDIGPS